MTETDSRFLSAIELKSVLSFGPESPEIQLTALNVLIGPNASGKSNLIECFELLRATNTDLTDAVRTGGGVAEWLWAYRKIDHASEILARVDPGQVMRRCGHCRRLFDLVTVRLQGAR